MGREFCGREIDFPVWMGMMITTSHEVGKWGKRREELKILH